MQVNMLETMPIIYDSFRRDALLVVAKDDALNACRKLPDDIFSLIVSSPPYNIGKNYEKELPLQEYIQWQETIISQLVRVMSKAGCLCWQVGNYINNREVFPLDIYFYPIFKKMGLILRNRIVWHFGHGLHASHRFSGRYETLLWFTKSDDYVFNLDAVRVPSKYPGKRHYKGDKRGQPSCNPLGKNPSDFWEIIAEEFESGVIEIPNVKSNHPEKTSHPCQFPIELIERCILAFTNENDWILDPFCGVGSALIAAIKHKRKAMGIDRDAEYCEIAKQRLTSYYEGTLKIRPIDKEIYKPTGRERVSQIPIEWLIKEHT
ncbi:adenine-specific DNA-methyltransferase [Candidatus Magnetobacterium bavaricum]|uniref:Methyltransferase n=1 Tax=Candidatus Magnetobacterium bavaricum TaxID=29290 RepID=A0A0F3GSA1_9BACT|nr:adenine-specific DNA-methyltransferase [Candidatus Magnetobacterium bavaricum]